MVLGVLIALVFGLIWVAAPDSLGTQKQALGDVKDALGLT